MGAIQSQQAWNPCSYAHGLASLRYWAWAGGGSGSMPLTILHLLGLLPDESFQQPSRQAGGHMAPNRQPQSPTTSAAQLSQQMGSSRQSQTQAVPPLHSSAAATHHSYTTPDRADQPVNSASQFSFFTCRFHVERGQQAAFLVAFHRLRGSLSVLVPAGTHEADSSAAGPSTSEVLYP